MAVVYFFPVLYLLRFANYAKQAALMQDQDSIEKAMKFLKYHYKFIGITMIAIFALYIVFIILAIVGFASMGGPF